MPLTTKKLRIMELMAAIFLAVEFKATIAKREFTVCFAG